jgi:pimeloyl-ACP methyl ester carboxylesterase
MLTTRAPQTSSAEVRIPADGVVLEGELSLPQGARAVVLFAHGSGSGRHSPRNQFVARSLQAAGIGTLLFDLLTVQEEKLDLRTRHLSFDIELLAQRLVAATRWLDEEVPPEGASGALPQRGGPTAASSAQRLRDEAGVVDLRPGYFGASTGGGAALVAAAELGARVGAVVSRGGRPDLAGAALAKVEAPTLLIVGELDEPVIRLNEKAYAQLRCEKALKIVPRATHLFEVPGTLELVAQLASDWFIRYLQR